MPASSVTVLFCLYCVGVARVWRHAGYGRGVRPFEALAFGAGSLSLVIALAPPFHAWSDRWLSAHMVQHELLMVVAAPLMAIGAPLLAFVWAMPSIVRHRLVSVIHRPPVTAAWRAITSPPSAFIVYGLALGVWHLPALYDRALREEAVHAAQHLCFFGAAALFWWGILHGRHGRVGYGAAVVYLFATALHSGVLGALLTLSPRVWYAPYAAPHPSGFTALEDQQLAGLLMWIPAGLAFVVGGLVMFAAWLRQSDRLSRFKSGAEWRPTTIT